MFRKSTMLDWTDESKIESSLDGKTITAVPIPTRNSRNTSQNHNIELDPAKLAAAFEWADKVRHLEV